MRGAIAIGAIAAGWIGGRADRPAIAPAALAHEAYVWQRTWTPAVRRAVASAPTEIAGLRVLALEVDDRGDAWPDLDVAALVTAARPVTAVVRIDGSRPIAGLSIAPVVERVAAWRRAGVEVRGIEIDHDCATGALADYATWLAAARPDGLRWSITALPTWVGSPALTRVAAAVDELVVQVHAVRTPAVFERQTARRWLAAFAAAVPDRPLAVALPTYRARVNGIEVAAEPAEVAGFVRLLERRPIAGVGRVAWFRLPVGDPTTWQTATLRAVIAGAPLIARVGVELVARDRGAYDVVVANAGTIDAPFPAVTVTGAVAYDLVRRDRVLPAGARVVAGWATGTEVAADAR